MKEIFESVNVDEAPLTLDEQRMHLRLRLQANRRFLVHAFNDEQIDNHFPRSIIMRFLTQQTTLHILKKIACTTIGIKTVNSVQYGFSLWQVVRNLLQKK